MKQHFATVTCKQYFLPPRLASSVMMVPPAGLAWPCPVPAGPERAFQCITYWCILQLKFCVDIIYICIYMAYICKFIFAYICLYSIYTPYTGIFKLHMLAYQIRQVPWFIFLNIQHNIVLLHIFASKVNMQEVYDTYAYIVHMSAQKFYANRDCNENMLKIC